MELLYLYLYFEYLKASCAVNVFLGIKVNKGKAVPVYATKFRREEAV